MSHDRVICYTLDLEHDYAGVAPEERYETLGSEEEMERLAAIVRHYRIELTVFATGHVLEQRRDAIDFFLGLGAEIELHGYNHSMHDPDFVDEVERGMDAYRSAFGRGPSGYRSPGGMTSPRLMEALVKAGVKYDSSIVPSFRWGTYNNLGSPSRPHPYPGLPLVELPISVVPGVRLPVATSYMRLLGWPTYRILFRLFGTPAPIVYLFHLVDLIPVQARKQLSPFLRWAYGRGQGEGLDVFEKSIRFFEANGYTPLYLSALYHGACV